MSRRDAWCALALAGAVLLLGLAAPGRPLAAVAETEPHPPWVAYLANEPTPETSAVLRAGLAGRGWVEGRSVKIWYRYAEGKFDIFPSHAAEMVRLGVNVIVAASPPAIAAARQATRTIPIVIATTDDPLAAGLATSLQHPGGTLTGVTLAAPGLARRRLELLTEIVPHVTRVAVLWNPTNPSNAAELKETEAAARARGIELVPVPLAVDVERRTALAAIARARAGGLLVLPDLLTITRRAELATFATRNRIPAVYPLPEFVDAGGLLAYGPSWRDAFERVAALVDQILRGTPASRLPIARPARFELHVNLRAAKPLELHIPHALLSRAERVVQ